jgi:tRNA pseudouridine32 synthase/23S rRNA pseudouridine746 synthase
MNPLPTFKIFDPAWLVHADQHLIVVNKPAGLRSQASHPKDDQHLERFVAEAFGETRLFHRLDRDTSGLVLFTRNAKAVNAWLDAAFKAQTVRKEYIALVSGELPTLPNNTLHDYLDVDPVQRDKRTVVPKGGQLALTDVEVLAAESGVQLLRLWPRTGRTHQLRVQLASRGCPILGDRLYGDAASAPRLMLHAHSLRLPASEEFEGRYFEVRAGAGFLHQVPAHHQVLI